MRNLPNIVSGLQKLAAIADLDAIRTELTEGYGWDDTLRKVFGKKSVNVVLDPDAREDHATVTVEWSFADRSGMYIYKAGEDPEDAARNIDALAKSIMQEKPEDRKVRQQKEKADLQQARLEEKAQQKEKEKKQKETAPKVDRNKVHDIKAGLADRGWKYSAIFGYYNLVEGHKVWTTFYSDNVTITSDVHTKIVLQFENLSADQAAQRIVDLAHRLVEMHKSGHDTAQKTFEEGKLLDALGKSGWEQGFSEGGVIRARRELRGAELPSIITVAFDLTSGRTNFAWVVENRHPIQILAWAIDLPANTKDIANKINILYESVSKRSKVLVEKLALELEKEKQKQMEDAAYQAWKAKQMTKVNQKDQEEAWKLRLDHELGRAQPK